MSPKHKLLTGNGAVRLTEGPIARQLIAFAVPLFLGSLIQQLYSTVDLMFVGKLIGRDASAAVGSSGLMVTCIVGFFTGLSVGVGVVAGQAAGRRDDRALTRIIHTAAGFTALMALVFLALASCWWCRSWEQCTRPETSCPRRRRISASICSAYRPL